jgi:glycosyltransferase involved in cell wall biosynthesis
MHLCIITHEYPKLGYAHGGIGSFIKTLAPKLVQSGVKVTVVGLNYENEFEYIEDKGVKIYRLKYKNIKRLGWYFGAKVISDTIAEIHKQDPIDIVEASELGLFCVKKILGIKYVIRLHGGHHFFAESEHRGINFWKGFQEKRSFKKADAFISVSNYVQLHTSKFLSFHNKPVILINYPIDIDFFSPKAVPIKKYSIVFVGSVCEKKGVRQLIQSFPFVKEQFPEAIIEIYGRDWFYPDGNSYTTMLLETELSKLGAIAKDIHFHGLVSYDKIPEKYAQAHVCVFPSHMETQGLVAPEAMAMKKVVVFTTQGPGRETITEYETGLLCNPFNPVDIAEKINWVFSNEAKAIEIENNARTFVLAKFSADSIVEKNSIFFKSLLNH